MLSPVIPAKAGIQYAQISLDPGLSRSQSGTGASFAVVMGWETFCEFVRYKKLTLLLPDLPEIFLNSSNTFSGEWPYGHRNETGETRNQHEFGQTAAGERVKNRKP
jgi:hypothetical protein